MGANDLPLVGREPLGLVEYLRGNIELADVVQQRGPVELVLAVGVEAELFADQVGIRAHAFAMSSGEAVVRTNRADHADDERGRVLARGELLVGVGSFQRALERFARPGS